MVKDFIVEYIKLIVKYPDLIEYKTDWVNKEDGCGEITIYVHPDGCWQSYW